MSEQTSNNGKKEDQPPEEVQPIGEIIPEEIQPSGEQLPVKPPPEKFKLNIWQFIFGFVGWFAIMFLLYLPKMDEVSLLICGGVVFLANIGALIFLLIKVRSLGFGMLAALALNMAISLILGLTINAFCLIPFFKIP